MDFKHNFNAEIRFFEEEFVKIAAEHLSSLSNGAFQDPRVRLLCEDASQALKQYEDLFDVAIIDCNDAIGTSEILFEDDFYATVSRALKSDGLCAVQTGSALDLDFLGQTRERIQRQLGTNGRYKYIRNLNSESTFNNIVTEKDQETFWRSWEREAKQNPLAAKVVNRYLKRPAEELYDLQTDPWEMTNLANSPEQQVRIKQMGRRLDAWMQQQSDRGMPTEGEATLHRSRKRRKQATADERN